VFQGLDNSKESIALSAVLDALSWRYVLEQPVDTAIERPGRRIVVYARFDSLGEYAFWFTRIEQEIDSFIIPPVLICDDDPAIVNWALLAESSAST
jgi:hypothetical protein